MDQPPRVYVLKRFDQLIDNELLMNFFEDASSNYHMKVLISKDVPVSMSFSTPPGETL